ncbi:MAG: hypothetical protein IKL31_11540, partial [Ruminococcus sp.]|nr:hypothetical protein [Ruminococcus sp.]
DYFVFGGLMLLDKKQKDDLSQRYSAAEKNIIKSEGMISGQEAKAAKFKIGTDTNENKAYLGFSKKSI